MFRKIVVKGSYYEMGFKLGKLFQKPIHENIGKFTEMLKDKEMAQKLSSCKQLILQTFHQCMDEIRGRAKGANVDEDSYLLMCNPELYKKPAACTTAIYRKEDCTYFSHNEDVDGLSDEKVALVKYEYDDHFSVAFTLYDRLAGSTHGYNSYGLVFSCNYIFHEEEDLSHLSRYVISRPLIDCKNIDEVLSILKNNKPAQPFSFNVLDIDTNEVMNIENDLNEIFITTIEKKFSRSNHFINKVNPKASLNSKYRYEYAKKGMDLLDDTCSCEDVYKVLCYENEEYVQSILMDPIKYKDINNSVTIDNMTFDSKKREVTFTDYLDRTQLTMKFDEFQ